MLKKTNVTLDFRGGLPELKIISRKLNGPAQSYKLEWVINIIVVLGLTRNKEVEFSLLSLTD